MKETSQPGRGPRSTAGDPKVCWGQLSVQQRLQSMQGTSEHEGGPQGLQGTPRHTGDPQTIQGTPKRTGDLRVHKGSPTHAVDPKKYRGPQSMQGDPKANGGPHSVGLQPAAPRDEHLPQPSVRRCPHMAGVTPKEARSRVTAPGQLCRWLGMELPPPTCPFMPWGCSARSCVLQEGGFQGWPHGSFLATLFQWPGSHPPHRPTPAPDPHGHGWVPPGHTRVLQDASGQERECSLSGCPTGGCRTQGERSPQNHGGAHPTGTLPPHGPHRCP